MKALVAVYSYTGRTVKVADQLKNELGADFARPEPQKCFVCGQVHSRGQ